MQKYERSKEDRAAIELLADSLKKEPILERKEFQLPLRDVPFWGYAFMRDYSLYTPELNFIQIQKSSDKIYWNLISKRGLFAREQAKPRKLPLDALTATEQTRIKEYADAAMLPNFDLFFQNNIDYDSLYAIAAVEPTGTLRLTLLVDRGCAEMTTVICEGGDPEDWMLRGYAQGNLLRKKEDLEKKAKEYKYLHWR